MSLRHLDLRDSYRSGQNRLAKEFFIPCLSEATSYQRAVGYFTSGSLSLVAPGLRRLVSRGGTVRIVASPHLDPADVEQIRLGYQVRDVVDRALARELNAATEQERLQLGMLGRLIADGKLDIRIALAHVNGRVGLYHEKVGLFVDASGDVVSFIGSMNETVQAHVVNLESFEVFKSWSNDDARRVAKHRHDFEVLWAGDDPAVEIFELPDIAAETLTEMVRELGDAEVGDEEFLDSGWEEASVDGLGELRIPQDVELRDYQRAAVECWFKNDGRGTLKMATGTGKTFTALAAASQLYRHLQRHGRPQLTIVVCPYQHLVDQWAGDMKAFGAKPVCCYESYSSWAPAVERLIAPLNAGTLRHLALVTTVATFRGQPFQKLLAKVSAPTLLIADEVHNMGAMSVRAALPAAVRYRLALSATPERWFDEEGTGALFEYFGTTVFDLPLSRAIELGALSPYRYTPILVTLDADESALYAELTAKIAQLVQSGSEPSDDGTDEVLGALLRRRAAVLGHASGKLSAFRRAVNDRSESWFQLVYCAEGVPPMREGEPSQVDGVLDLLGNGMRKTVDRYVSDTPREERRRLLRRFGSGDDLQYLVSMRCLDEGVDLPDARIAYLLASSSNPRQFIQRRGRILRLPKDGSRKVAEIVDFVAVPGGDGPDGSVAATDQSLLRREMQRVMDFAALAVNGPQAREALLDVRRRYHLLDM